MSLQILNFISKKEIIQIIKHFKVLKKASLKNKLILENHLCQELLNEVFLLLSYFLYVKLSIIYNFLYY